MRDKMWIGAIAAFVALCFAGGCARRTHVAPKPELNASRPTLGSDNIGETVPDFTLQDIEGKKVSLSDFIDKEQIFVLELGACT